MMTSSSPPPVAPPVNPRDQQFCLRWNNYQSNLVEVFNELFQSEKFVDVTLACEGHHLQAHRLVLAACSPYFCSILSDTSEHPVVILQGIRWVDLRAVVDFIYKGEINVCQEQLSRLLKVADLLKIRGLTEVEGEEPEAVLTTPSGSPIGAPQFWGSDPSPRKRRRLTEDEKRSSSRSRSPTPVWVQSPESIGDPGENGPEIPTPFQGPLSKPCPPNPPHIPNTSPVVSLNSPISSLAHLHSHGPMPPPGPPLPPHLAHLPPMSPISPLLNMHPMPRPPGPDDFDIRPGIAEMIREEERAKMLESHHWIPNPMADSYQAQVQAAWQKSWNQTQSLLQNLRFRERGPLKSWRPETMAEAIHSVLKEGLSLSQAARKYDIPYPTFVLYANRVHNLLGPSHEQGDLRPKGRGRPQRILLGAWPDDQIKGVIRAVVYREFREGEHKENKKPPASQIKDEVPRHTQSSSSRPENAGAETPNGTPDKSRDSTPVSSMGPNPPQQFSHSSNSIVAKPPTPNSSRLPSPFKEAAMTSPNRDNRTPIAPASSAHFSGNHVPANSISINSSSSATTQTNSIRSSHVVPNGPSSGPPMNGIPSPHSSVPGTLGPNINGIVLPNLPSANGLLPSPLSSQHASKSSRISPDGITAKSQQLQSSNNNLHLPPNQLHSRLPLNSLGPLPPTQQMLGLIAGGLNPSLANSPAHMARLLGEIPHIRPPPGGPMSLFPSGFPRPGMPPVSMQNPPISRSGRLEEQQEHPSETILGKFPNERLLNIDIGQRQIGASPPQTVTDHNPGLLERPPLFKESMDSIKSEPEAIAN